MPEENSKIKIFVGYKGPNILFKSDVYQPILTAPVEWNNPDVIKDNTGINIADKNKNYAELTGHYWAWKNFLPHTCAEYIGFCHYRRFLDFGFTPMPNVAFKPIYRSEFQKIFKKYTQENILEKIEGYDIILPHKTILLANVYSQYLRWHPMEDMNLALNIIRDDYPEYVPAAYKVMASNKFYTCINFIMKKELLNEYFEWMFDILTKLEAKTDWSKYDNYFNIRTPAYIVERFINIWIEHNIEKRSLKVLNTSSFILMGKGYEGIPPDRHKLIYSFQVKLLNDELKA